MFNVQVKHDLYFSKKYDSLERFVSYYYQTLFVIECQPKRVLEIGIGNKTVSHNLSHKGIDVVTCDFDKELNPDVVADIRNLPFKDNEFDAVLACEILEHLPYSDFCTILSELSRVSKRNVIISLPHRSSSFSIEFKIKLLNIFDKKFLRSFGCLIKLPHFWQTVDINKNGQHYWELGARKYSRKKIRQEILKYFQIIKEIQPKEDNNHVYYVLKKIN